MSQPNNDPQNKSPFSTVAAVAGAAVAGVAAGAVAAVMSDPKKREELSQKIEHVAHEGEEKVHDAVSQGKKVIEDVRKNVDAAVDKAKSDLADKLDEVEKHLDK